MDSCDLANSEGISGPRQLFTIVAHAAQLCSTARSEGTTSLTCFSVPWIFTATRIGGLPSELLSREVGVSTLSHSAEHWTELINTIIYKGVKDDNQ